MAKQRIITAPSEADRQRRDEPVGIVRHFQHCGIARSGFTQAAVVLEGAPNLPEGTKLYAAPQPAEPSPELMRLMPEVLAALKCSGLNVSLAEDVERALLAQPAEPEDDDLNLDRLANYIADNWPDKKYSLEEIAQRLHATSMK